MIKRISLALIVATILITFMSLTSAVTCDSNSFTQTYQQGSIPTTELTITTNCVNTANQSVNVFANGDFYTLIDAPFSIGVGSTKGSLRIRLNQDIEPRHYDGFIAFSDGSTPIHISLDIAQTQVQQGVCQINPSLVSYNQQVQQGTKIPLPKITFSPIDCPSQLILTPSSVSIQGGVITTQGQKPVFISSVESDGINIEIDTTGLNSQTYNSKLKITAFNKQFEIPFTIIVTGGTSTSGNFDISKLPKCSLTNNVINLNDTHSLVCSNLVPDVSIIPRIDNEYIRGVGLETSANQFSWLFQGKKMGNTIIYADFLYLGVPVGDPFSQEIKIQSSSGQSPGTSLIILFTPELEKIKSGDEILIQVIDNKTKSLVDNPSLYIDSLPIESNSKTFKYIFQSDKNYTIRATAQGYSDYINHFSLILKPLIITISPESGDADTLFEIKTNEENATLFLDNVQINNPFSQKLSAGNHVFKAIKTGFVDGEKNITVGQGLSISNSGEFKKGVLQSFQLNKNASWVVYYAKPSESIPEYTEVYQEGQSDKIEFEPTKAGSYRIQSGEKILADNLTITGFSLKWYWYVIIALIIILVIYFVYRRNKQSSVFTGNVVT